MNDGQNAPATSRKRPASPSTVPSITIQVTKADAQQFTKASDAIALILSKTLADASSSSTLPRESETSKKKDTPSPIHEMLHQAALDCNEEALAFYKKRLNASSLTQPERKASFLLFHKSEFDEKLKAFFLAFSAGLDDDLPKPDLLSLFRTILTSITSCCGTEILGRVVVEGQPPEPNDPPQKKRRKEEGTVTTKETTHHTSAQDLQAVSFDLSLATLPDEDHPNLLKEIEAVAAFATNHLLTFVKDKSIEKTSVHSLNRWYREKGREVAPWLELLSASKWEDLAHITDPSITSPLTGPSPKTNQQKRSSSPWKKSTPEPKNESPTSPRRPSPAQTPAASQSPLQRQPSSTSGKKPSPSNKRSAPPPKEPSPERATSFMPPLEPPRQTSAAATKLPSPAYKIAPRTRLALAEQRQPSPTHDHSSPSNKENRRTGTEAFDQIDFNKDSLFDEAVKRELLAAADFDSSKPLVSFDFSGSGHPEPLCIEISENNLYALRHFVHRTGLMHLPAPRMCKKLIRLANRRTGGRDNFLTLSRHVWMNSINDVLGEDVWSQLTLSEREAFKGCLTEIFSCFEGNKPSLRNDEVDIQEFAIGFCFFCSGNKSTKLATGFEVLDEYRKAYLTEDQLRRYLTSYLTTLVAMSMLAPISSTNSTGVVGPGHRRDIRSAVESGAKWTLGHFLRHFDDHGHNSGRYSFESFALWYSNGGYEVAPWLELLDLKKIFSLIGNLGYDGMGPPGSLPPYSKDKMSSLRRHHSTRKGPPPEVLFTFPLAGHRSLVVLKDDASYVRSVVDHLGLLSMNPNELWSKLSRMVEKKKKAFDSSQGTVYVSMDTFLSCMDEISPGLKRSRAGHADRIKATEILSNFFQCFDLEQSDSVAIDELMGGLTLLCGGKKSHKLAFAFGVFDTRPGIHLKKKKENITHSLSGEDLFLFLRSILIVTFSCCRQSLDMTDVMVGRCIADTANMICNDVMRHQWDLRHKDRLNFDEFGQWYNEGGFERAPWLELLDLKKWVLIDMVEPINMRHDQVLAPAKPPPPATSSPDPDVPPPPSEDELDADFFESSIMPMDSIDEMDMILMQPSTDKDIDLGSPRITQSFASSPETATFFTSPKSISNHRHSNRRHNPPLKFNLSTNECHGGYSLSMSHGRIAHLRRILEVSSLHKMEAELVCNRILSKATKTQCPQISKDDFDSVVRSIISSPHLASRDEERSLFHVLADIFTSFDRDGSGKINAIEVACGITVLCNGKKSDKLEFAFDVLEKRKRGQLNREDMTSYLKSFLTVLLTIAFSAHLNDDPCKDNSLTTLQGHHCDRSPRTLASVVDSGALWATQMAFEGHVARQGSDRCMSMSFDDFAEWYTTKGYSSIPWLELLDLRKWVFNTK